MTARAEFQLSVSNTLLGKFRCIVLASTIPVLMIAQTAAAGGGNGPQGGAAAVAIDSVLLVNPTHPSDRFTRAEIAGGGFLNVRPARAHSNKEF